MKISVDWLSEFVQVPAEPGRLEARLPMLGLGVASVEYAGAGRVLDLEVTTNRPDCLGHLGVAREVAAAFGSELRRRALSVRECARPARQAVSIVIEDVRGCARYCGRVLEGVSVRPSPHWLASRLEAVGVRPVNNVADVTNYVLMELGHPLHAFDLARLGGASIVVRRARAGEKLKTLDGVERVLAPEDLVIADGAQPVALAGVMGGEDSEIGPATRRVMLESAWFEPVGVRRSAKRHGLHTEASHRFERGADVEMARQAIDRAAELMVEVAGGEALEGVIDVYPDRRLRPTLELRPAEIRRVLGVDIPGETVAASLSALGFDVEWGEGGAWRVIPPTFRLDVGREVDLIEELARLYGYDRLPVRVRPAPPRVDRDARREKELAVSAALVGLGYREIIVPAMVDPDENAQFTRELPVPLLNPLAQDASALRSSAVPGMLRALRWNLDRGESDLGLFETGKVYTVSARTDEGLPAERRVLTLGLSGTLVTAGVHDAVHPKRRPVDAFDLKGALEALWELFDAGDLTFAPSGRSYHEPGTGGSYAGGGGELACFGQLGSEAARGYKLRQPVYVAEIELERMLALPLRARAFRPFPRYPAVERDLSLVVPNGVAYRDIEAALGRLRLEGLQGFRALDRFEGGALPPGHYSLLVRIVLQSPERTLTSEAGDAAARAVLGALEELGVRLRGA